MPASSSSSAPRHPTTDWAEYAAIQSSCLHKSTHKRPGLANLLHPWHLHAPFPTNLDPRGPLWLEKRGSKVAAAISLFVYLDLRWRQGLWRAHHHHHRSGQAGSSPRLNQDWSSSRQRSGLRHIFYFSPRTWLNLLTWTVLSSAQYTFHFPRTLANISSRAMKLIICWFPQCRIPFESRHRQDPINSMSGGRSLGVRVGCAMHTADLRPWAQGIPPLGRRPRARTCTHTHHSTERASYHKVNSEHIATYPGFSGSCFDID